MLDIVITVVLLLLTMFLNVFLEIDDVILESLVELIPMIILTGRLLYNYPRNYMYVLGMFNRNVKYEMTVKLKECDIDKKFFDDLCEKLRKMYESKDGKVIKKNEGAYLWNVYLEIDASLIEITYNFEEGNLYIETKSKTRFRNFVCEVERVIDNINDSFSLSECKCNGTLINITIGYMNRKREDVKNPMITKFFACFTNLVMNLRYEAKGGSKFVIHNDGVSVTAKNLKLLKKDIRKEMLLF